MLASHSTARNGEKRKSKFRNVRIDFKAIFESTHRAKSAKSQFSSRIHMHYIIEMQLNAFDRMAKRSSYEIELWCSLLTVVSRNMLVFVYFSHAHGVRCIDLLPSFSKSNAWNVIFHLISLVAMGCCLPDHSVQRVISIVLLFGCACVRVCVALVNGYHPLLRFCPRFIHFRT